MGQNSTIDITNFPVKRYNFNYDFIGAENLATLNLLKSSVLVSISGALRIHIAFLLLHISSIFLHCFAGGLIIYSVYTLDRAMDAEEDSVNRSELKGASNKIALLLSLICFIIGATILASSGMLLIAFIPLITGYLYTKGLDLGRFKLRLKGGMGIKNLVVGITWGSFIAGIAGYYSASILATLLVFIFFGTKLFVNSAIYDFKDIKGDTLAGINTLPVSLGEKNTRNLLFGLHIIAHLILSIFLLKNVIAFEPIILIYSFIAGVLSIRSFTKPIEFESMEKETKRLFLVDGESSSIMGLKTIASCVM
ncbi:UbiA family prenyltransferase [Methanolobus sp. ZRKC3]|uniref:UbiA family prenyltransferase n=1 Tax=Methanolobus sp. ZRKC3 TaxID=3125786 RepID=UPI00324863A1